jgi:hypothetical protein
MNCVEMFEAITLNQMTLQRWVADVSDVETHLSEIFRECVYCSLTVDGSLDITSVAQMCIFVCGIMSDFEVFEELVDLHSIQGQIKGLDFI